MSTAPSTAVRHERSAARFRNFAVAACFAVVLLVPKLLRIRRSPASWFVFRTLLGIAGVALVLLPLTLSTNWIAAPAGLAMFLASILLPPAKRPPDVDAKSGELGALVVLNGGMFQSPGATPAPVQLFVGPEKVDVLDSQLQPLLTIHVAGISACTLLQNSDGWLLRILWSAGAAEFAYRGFFAEHLACVAQTTIAGLVSAQLPVLQRSRAAGA